MKVFWLATGACIASWGTVARFVMRVMEREADMQAGFVTAGTALVAALVGLVASILAVRKMPPRSTRRSWAVCVLVLNSVAVELGVLLAVAMVLFSMAVADMLEYM